MGDSARCYRGGEPTTRQIVFPTSSATSSAPSLAIATPTGDPWTMTALAVPMLLLFVGAATLCLILDRRRRSACVDGLNYDTLDDDAASPLDTQPRPLDDDGDDIT